MWVTAWSNGTIPSMTCPQASLTRPTVSPLSPPRVAAVSGLGELAGPDAQRLAEGRLSSAALQLGNPVLGQSRPCGQFGLREFKDADLWVQRR
jgi:hypothetical protein